MELLLKPISGLLNMIVSFINGLIVGTITFVTNLLDGLDGVDSLTGHALDSIKSFFGVFMTLGQKLLPFLPPEWVSILEISLVVLVIGLIIRKKVL